MTNSVDPDQLPRPVYTILLYRFLFAILWDMNSALFAHMLNVESVTAECVK